MPSCDGLGAERRRAAGSLPHQRSPATRCPRRSAGSSASSGPPAASPTTPGPGGRLDVAGAALALRLIVEFGVATSSQLGSPAALTSYQRTCLPWGYLGPLVGRVAPTRGRPPARVTGQASLAQGAGRGSPRGRRPSPTRWEGTCPADPRPPARGRRRPDAGSALTSSRSPASGLRRRQHGDRQRRLRQVLELDQWIAGSSNAAAGRCAPRRATAIAAAPATRCSPPARPPGRGSRTSSPGAASARARHRRPGGTARPPSPRAR